MSQIPWLDHTLEFPSISTALADPDGLLAAGGDLSPDRLLHAYSQGIFPWYSEGQPILWWSPDPRCIILPHEVHVSRSLKKFIRQSKPTLTFDTAFAEVIRHCARLDADEGTWITEEMEEAYLELHHLGFAHSVEVWDEQELIGGLYGIAIGRCFFGESMFSLRPNASKVAFTGLCKQLDKWKYAIIDCQVENPHLLTLGAYCIDRKDFLSILNKNKNLSPEHTHWQFS